ncbi:hypothetical protein DRO54_06285 [Candidatus Bathyarchaeota archaeon]|nr:MAG: hypothetical protein DRO54_06285 [Candidatus Bathyarchaeota archaeon]
MKKLIIAALVALLMVGLTLSNSFLFIKENMRSSNVSSVSARPLMVGVYYYIWWGISFNPHWNECIKGTPFLGKYNSSDPRIANQHILLAKQHGISFFAVSWFGEGSWTDWDFDDINNYLRNGLLRASYLQSFNFCLFYETKVILNHANRENRNFTEIFINDMVYAARNYFNHSSYLHVRNAPVIFIYNLPYLYSVFPVDYLQKVLDCIRQKWASMGYNVYVVGDIGNGSPTPFSIDENWLYSMNATTTYFYSNPAKGWSCILEEVRIYYPQWASFMGSKGLKFIPNAYPGFNNTGLENVTNPAALPFNETAFREMLTIAINNTDKDLNMVMITSWNEWLEGTAIEPSMEYGETFLHIIYCVVPEFQFNICLLFLLILSITASLYMRREYH